MLGDSRQPHEEKRQPEGLSRTSARSALEAEKRSALAAARKAPTTVRIRQPRIYKSQLRRNRLLAPAQIRAQNGLDRTRIKSPTKLKYKENLMPKRRLEVEEFLQ